jgi:hypothetical protein
LNPELLLAFVPGFRRLAENTPNSQGNLQPPQSVGGMGIS